MRFLHAIVVLIGIIRASTAYRDLDWYECMLQYQIYPRSFKDSDGDGIGDLRGRPKKFICALLFVQVHVSVPV